jgi:CHAD domain-containing protein
VIGIATVSAGLGLSRSRAFEVVRRSFCLPDLTALEPVAKVTDPVESQLTTTYYDTADLRLAARDTSVRRTGSRWVLRTHADDGSVVEVETEAEADAPEAEDGVPADLGEVILGSVRDKGVEPVACVRTTRVERRLLDIDGRELARIADDVVDGQRFTTGCVELSHWRQLTVELIGGAADLLDLVAASLDPMTELPTGDETLHRVLGRPARPVLDLRGDDPDASAAGVLRDRLRTEISAIVDLDWAVRTGRPDAVADMRRATLRLRCDLATWKPYIDGSRTEPIRDELHWLAGVLGLLRDAEMLDTRLVGTIQDLPADMVVGPVRSRVGNELSERKVHASAGVHAALDGGRYFALLDDLETLAEAAPFTAHADGPADELLVERLAHAVGRVRRALAPLDLPATSEVRADQLRTVRKAARRAGFAAEALEPRFERRARRLADRMRGLEDALGRHRDSVVARQALTEIGAVAHIAGESAFTYGVLHGIERDRGVEAERTFEAARRSLGSTKVRRWLIEAAGSTD